ncbi:response regulator transcription factor [Herbaspirillum sp. NPDC087042]|uniref:response regulator transcription factor n=1 Tax=Herbaspirillum sp. NPDC087042 TaxID=3364004 RepID=UPI0037FF2FDD
MNIAILEDDPLGAELVRTTLTQAGHDCQHFSTGTALLAALQRTSFDLLVLDWMLPDMTGHQVLDWVRAHLGRRMLVLILSSRSLEEHVVLGLMAGGDDYMIKPARRAELLARVHVLSRRLPSQEIVLPPPSEVIEVGPYRLHKIKRVAHLAGVPVELRPKEFDIACLLFSQPGAVVSREALVEQVWGRDLVASRTLDTHMSLVRSKLALRPENGVKLITIYTLGYRLDLVDPEDDF